MDDKSKFLELLAVAVAGGSTIRSAAEAIGCSESHAYHLSSSQDFKHRVSELRSEIASATVGILTDGATKAASTLVSLLDESNEPSVRLAASKAVLASVGAITELGELRSRIDALEKSALSK